MVLMMTTFYCTQWEEYYTGTLTLGYIGVTEAQISAMTIYLLTSYVGVGWWNQQLHVFGWSIRYGNIPMLVSATSMVPTALSNFKEVILFHMRQGKLSGLAVAFSKVAPILFISCGFLGWATYSPIYYSHPQMFLLAYGFLVANLVGRIVLDRVCQDNFQPLQPLMFPIVLFPFVTQSPQLELAFLFLYCVLAIAAYFHFALSVIQDLCEALQINCLSLRKQKK